MGKLGAVFGALLFLGACTNSTEPYPEDKRVEFIETCASSNPSVANVREVCECVIDESARRMSYSAFRDLDAALQKGRATSQQRSLLSSIFSRCVDRNPG
ncbi:MAG: hypothetical protein R3360_04120 [Alphaproteobacteria bacterium]|nr:hypothetical protein [Alphaproteobacteria bacterium]